MGRDTLKQLGYPTDTVKCRVCGKIDENQTEPRFYYTVCKTHRWMTPVEVSRYPEK